MAASSNTNDPSLAHLRVFVGNLNTMLLKKEDVENIFRRYGFVTGVSVHKGFAFVQYNNPIEARRASAMEHGKIYANQQLDCNIASERGKTPRTPNNAPGPRGPPRPQGPGGPGMHMRPPGMGGPGFPRPVRPAGPRMGQSGFPRPVRPTNHSGSMNAGPPNKKPRLDNVVAKKRTLVTLSGDHTEKQTTISTLSQAAQDVLICGVCKSAFKSLHSLAQHKKIPCRLRTACQCQDASLALKKLLSSCGPSCVKPKPKVADSAPLKTVDDTEPQSLACATCDAEFSSAWSLCQHVQQEHSVSLYKSDDDEQSSSKQEVVTEVNGGES